VLWIRNDYFGSVYGSGPYFSVGFGSNPVSDPIPVAEPTGIFYNLNIKFNFVFPSCKSVGLHMRYTVSFLGKNFFDKNELYF
jgi:hypothetical protein